MTKVVVFQADPLQTLVQVWDEYGGFDEEEAVDIPDELAASYARATQGAGGREGQDRGVAERESRRP